jgi:hypothetical protein
VTLSVPPGNEVVVSVATPLVNVAVPTDAPPLENVMVSPLVLVLPALKGERVAVRVTGWPAVMAVWFAATTRVVGVVTPLCVTVKVWPGMVIVPVRGPPVLASTVYPVAPESELRAPAVIWIQLALLTELQTQ